MEKDIIDPNEEIPPFKLKIEPNLQHISTARIVIELWMQDDVKEEILNAIRDRKRGQNIISKTQNWIVAESLVVKQIMRLPVPERLKQSFQDMVAPIGNEISDWIFYTFFTNVFKSNILCEEGESSSRINIRLHADEFLECLLWTAMGRIDYKKTAEKIVNEGGVSNECKYELACAYYLEDKITHLAHKLYIRKNSPYIWDGGVFSLYWSHSVTGNPVYLQRLRNKVKTVGDIKSIMFESSISYGNEHALQFMWRNFDEAEKKTKRARVVDHSQRFTVNFMCFMLSEADHDKQKEILKTFGYKILQTLFSDWMWIDKFFTIWDYVSKVITRPQYNYLHDELACSYLDTKCSKRKTTLENFLGTSSNYLKSKGAFHTCACIRFVRV